MLLSLLFFPFNLTAGAVVDIDVRSDEPQDNPATHSGITPDYSLHIVTPNAKYTDKDIVAQYVYERNHVEVDAATKAVTVRPGQHEYEFKTERKVGKTGVMLVGWGGNNGSTITASILANKHGVKWNTKVCVVVDFCLHALPVPQHRCDPLHLEKKPELIR